MRYLVLASDYDGTLAHDGTVAETTIAGIERLIRSGRKLILVTGRELPDLQSVFPRIDLCERIVAENGALLYDPASKQSKRLAERPPDTFIADLKRRGVSDMSVGEVIVANWRPHEREAIEAIRDAGLELQVIFNKEAVMILPSGVNKMTGLCAALKDLKLSAHNVVAVGDAENDHAFLQSCEFPVAVANAIPALKQKAAMTTYGARGAGVVELIDRLIDTDLAEFESSASQDCLVIGRIGDKRVRLSPYGRNILVCGPSASGKSTAVIGLIEQIIDKRYQVCLIDPEGDYEDLKGCRTIGDETHPPSVKEVMQVLDDPDAQTTVNLTGVPGADRPGCFASLFSRVHELRLHAGRPHWLVIDEAHHVLPAEWTQVSTEVTEQLRNTILITVHPKHTSRAVLEKVNTIVVVGREPKKLFQEFAGTIDVKLPDMPERDLEQGEAAIWWLDKKELLFGMTIEPSRTDHHRHKRKYAEGQLEEERIFRFRGSADKLNLRAQNLKIFIQLAEGIDTETWLYHLKRGDYSNWFRRHIKDNELADRIAELENDESLSDKDSRERVTSAIAEKYTSAE